MCVQRMCERTCEPVAAIKTTAAGEKSGFNRLFCRRFSRLFRIGFRSPISGMVRRRGPPALVVGRSSQWNSRPLTLHARPPTHPPTRPRPARLQSLVAYVNLGLNIGLAFMLAYIQLLVGPTVALIAHQVRGCGTPERGWGVWRS